MDFTTTLAGVQGSPAVSPVGVLPSLTHPAPHQITRVALGDLSLTLFCSSAIPPSQVEVDELADLLKIQAMLERRRRDCGYPSDEGPR